MIQKNQTYEPNPIGWSVFPLKSLNIFHSVGKCSGIVEDDFRPVAGASVIVKRNH